MAGQYDMPENDALEMASSYLSNHSKSWDSLLLLNAIYYGNIQAFRLLVECGHPVEGQFFSPGSHTPPYKMSGKHPLLLLGLLAMDNLQVALAMLQILVGRKINLNVVKAGRNEKEEAVIAWLANHCASDALGGEQKNRNLCAFIKELINQGADINYQDEMGRTALFAFIDSKMVLDGLLSLGADPYLKDKNGCTAGKHHRDSAMCGSLVIASAGIKLP